MFSLTKEQEQNIGLSYVLENFTFDSPYGQKWFKTHQIFNRDSSQKLGQHFDNMEAILQLIQADTSELSKLRKKMMRLKYVSGILMKLEGSTLSEIELFELKYFLLIFEGLQSIYNELNISLKGINFTTTSEALNLLDPHNKRIPNFHLDIAYSDELKNIRLEKRNLEKKIVAEKDEVKKEQLLDERQEIIAREVEVELQVREQLSATLRAFIPIIKQNIDSIGHLDVIIAQSFLAFQTEATKPQTSEEKVIHVKNMTNPYVQSTLAKKRRSFTPVTIKLENGVTIITGANMGGKSVAIQTLVLNTVLHQHGFFVYADEAILPLFDDIAYLSGDLQSVSQGLSTFGSEMMAFNQITQDLKEKYLLVVLDEFSKGTNPMEGTRIVKGIANFLAEEDAISIMTTHYDNVLTPRMKHYQVVGLTIPQKSNLTRKTLSELEQYMDYRLIEVTHGKETPKNALEVCKILGLNQKVLEKIEAAYLESPII